MPDADEKTPTESGADSTASDAEHNASGADQEEEEQAPTPFDHPLFLPVLLSSLTLWFGYDGWLNTDPDMLEHVTFNRVGFGLLLVGAIYTGIGGYKEWKEDQE
jgi:hypothetical protein